MRNEEYRLTHAFRWRTIGPSVRVIALESTQELSFPADAFVLYLRRNLCPPLKCCCWPCFRLPSQNPPKLTPSLARSSAGHSPSGTSTKTPTVGRPTSTASCRQKTGF